MKAKRLSIIAITIITIAVVILFTQYRQSTPAVSTDLSALETDINNISVTEQVQIVGLGEASHGVKEYHQMKGEVFKALVNNNECRTFIIEGDFGGALKVDAYIHGGSGTAKEVVKEIGFAIYKTEEMVDLIEWMRSYNETASDSEQLHFYGMDMQRYDNNKEYLFAVLDEAAPELSEKYKTAFASLTDEARLDLDANVLKNAKTDALALMKEMDNAKTDIVASVGQEKFDFARECANTIYMCSDVMLSSSKEYNTLRDNYMFQKVQWFMQQEEGLLFINGHNGHIGKSSVSNYTCLGNLLADSLGENYFAIGTDAMNTKFNSQNNNGEFGVIEVSNKNSLNSQFDNMENDFYYIDFSKVAEDKEWQDVLSSKQRITTLNVGLEGWQKISKSFYTTKIIPNKTFDGMLVFENVSPTTLIEK